MTETAKNIWFTAPFNGRDGLRLESSQTYWHEIFLEADAWNALREFHGGSQSPLPVATSNKRLYTASRRVAEQEAARANMLVGRQAALVTA